MKYKALLLLTIFLLNNVVGFACALTMDADHHGGTAIQEKHSHISSATQPGEQVEPHGRAKNKPHDHGSHEHAKPSEPVSKTPLALKKQIATIATGDDACCQDDVNNFTSLAKLIPQKGNFDIKAPVFDMGFQHPLSTLFKLAINESARVYFVPDKDPPPQPDIRIIIQSFLI